MDIFAQASEQKLSFPNLGKGVLSTQDLWDLSVDTLNTAALMLDRLIAETGEQGYLRIKSTADAKLVLQRDIIVYIIGHKLDKQDANIVANKVSQEQKELLELIHAKKVQARANKSLEDLEAEYNALVTKK